MPERYPPERLRDIEPKKTKSQSLDTNVATEMSTVQKLMDRKGGGVITIGPEETLHAAVEKLRDHRIGALVVTEDGGDLIGILSERDIVRKLADTPGRTLRRQVKDVMTTAVEVCTPDEPVVSVLRRMTKGRFRHMPVTRDNRLTGMITIGDVVQDRLNELEYEALQLKQMIVG